jgi:transposase
MADFHFYIGIDCGSRAHRTCLLDGAGKILDKRSIEHDGKDIIIFLDQLRDTSPPASVAIALETPRGAFIEAALERGFAVFSLNPKQLDRFRDRFSPAGAKDDDRDAYVLADSLRTDLHCFHRVQPDAPEIIRLRELVRAEAELNQNFQRAANQLFDLVQRYRPELLHLSTCPDEPWIWDLLELAPTAEKAARLTPKRIQRLLAQAGIRRWTAEQVHAIVLSRPLPLTAGSHHAIAEHALLLLPQLRLFHRQRKQLAHDIQAILDQLAAPNSPGETVGHRDAALLLSLPGVGRVVAATMLAEAPQPLARRDYHALRAYAGVAPVTQQSGKTHHVQMRYGCNQRLRLAVYHWARVSVMCEARSKQHYARLRAAGKSHGRALRGIADRLLKMLLAILASGVPYDPARRLIPTAQTTNAQ